MGLTPPGEMNDPSFISEPGSWINLNLIGQGTIGCTPPETNIFAHENGWLEYYFLIGMAYFQGRTVSFREATPIPVYHHGIFRW